MITSKEYERITEIGHKIIMMPESLGDYLQGSLVLVSRDCYNILLEHYQELKALSEEEFLRLEKMPDSLPLTFYLENSEKIKRTFVDNPKKEKSTTEMATEVLDLKISKNQKEISEYLVKHFLAKYNTYTVRDDNTTEIWIYKEGIYVSEGKSYIQEFVRAVLGKDFKMSLCKEVVDKIIIDTYIDPDDFFQYDKNLNFIPVQNGLLHIYERRLYEFDSEKIFFNKLPVKFDRNAHCPKIKQFFEDICRDKSDIETLRQFIGTCLERENKYERMLMCIGGGRNGKSKFADLIKRFLGSYNCAGLQPSSFENPESFQTYLLHGKLANMYMDISKTAFKNTSLLKSLSGGDPITVPRKYKSPLTFKNTASFIFGANELPMSYDISSGFWERWLLIDFPYTFSYDEIIATLEDKDKWKHKPRIDNVTDFICSDDELSGMLNWVLDGLYKLKNAGKFSYKYTPEEVKSLWVRKSDSFSAFFMDRMEVDYDFKISKAEVRREYAEYCKEHKLKHMSDKHINNVLSEQGITTGRHKESGESDYYWIGASIKPKFRVVGIDGSLTFKKLTQKEQIKDYIEANPRAKKQDLMMRFGHKIVDKLLFEGDLIEVKNDEVKIR